MTRDRFCTSVDDTGAGGIERRNPGIAVEPCAAKPATMASRMRSASCSSHQAKIVGPAPEIEQPSAPLCIAPSLTAWKPGISTLRCGSMITSSSDSRIRRRSPVKQPVRNPARFADCQITFDRSIERFRISRASRVDSIMCGWTSTQRTVGGTGICLTFGLSMPTVSTSPPNSDGAMLSTCTEPLATASPLHRELQQLELARATSATAHSPRRRQRQRSRRATESRTERNALLDRELDAEVELQSRTMLSTAMPAVFFSGSRGRSTSAP